MSEKFDKSWKKFVLKYGNDGCGDYPSVEDIFGEGWDACKKEVLKIVKKSYERYVGEIEGDIENL